MILLYHVTQHVPRVEGEGGNLWRPLFCLPPSFADHLVRFIRLQRVSWALLCTPGCLSRPWARRPASHGLSSALRTSPQGTVPVDAGPLMLVGNGDVCAGGRAGRHRLRSRFIFFNTTISLKISFLIFIFLVLWVSHRGTASKREASVIVAGNLPKLSSKLHPCQSPRSAGKEGDNGLFWGFSLGRRVIDAPLGCDPAAQRHYCSWIGNKQILKLIAAPLKCRLRKADVYGHTQFRNFSRYS